MKRGNSLYNVKTKGLFNLKINREVRDEFKAAAELRGATMSSLIHQYIYRFIREVKTEMPDEFEEKLAELLAEKRAIPIEPLPADFDHGQHPSALRITSSTKKGGKK